MNAQAQMPRYKCHKEVWALKIKNILPGGSPEEPGCTLEFEDKRYAPRFVSEKSPVYRIAQTGGYFVVYKDGYESYSPAEAFEEGYALITG